MIKIKKLAVPLSLQKNSDKWTEELMSFINAGKDIPYNVKNRYNQDDVKQALINETSGKCMYCESLIRVVSYEHIEHYRPKAIFPEKTFEWSNLGLACQVCNDNKHNNFDEKCAFVNPYIENPNKFFIFLGNTIWPKPGNTRAEYTRDIISLNRPELIEARQERINSIYNLVVRYKNERNESLKAVLRKNVLKEMNPDKPYSRCVQSFVESITNEKW